MFYRFARCLFTLIIKILFKVEVEGLSNLPKEGPVVVCANHISWWDPPLVACLLDRPLHFMAKKELFGYPVFGWILRKLYAFPVNRNKVDISAIKEGLNVLKNGEVVGIFPEGTRQKNRDRLGEIHPGAALLALKSGAPLFPVAIRGSYGFRKTIRVACGDPFYLKAGTGQLSSDLKRGAEDIMSAIRTLWERLAPDEAA
ncbi:MAG TPA: 1-acyl-sn-glycerol-3-phosphate acyltransferase [Firmicutes bacterium]|uniref:1-acyl-sn-glycerol-3-phosphate acyltransferase n=1 Tax=Candidatus Fermentithermobacillus carboniphilus TaxID=3085328 RepID=A0AAT9LDS3_9FIRM|nr:MAG: 1-acyl-sn-glycerol-3-phosphate acyltransferase [Candidatus Fermentithermobacillus carboniphilus]HHW17986.1 1-acyl-sn-glycerol-3-phosphate acyltransferase [Candidatus Fermentithermobacillaceae bacterium]